MMLMKCRKVRKTIQLYYKVRLRSFFDQMKRKICAHVPKFSDGFFHVWFLADRVTYSGGYVFDLKKGIVRINKEGKQVNSPNERRAGEGDRKAVGSTKGWTSKCKAGATQTTFTKKKKKKKSARQKTER